MFSSRSLVAVGLLGFGLALSPGIYAGSQSCESRNNNNLNKLLECVTVDGVRAH